MWGYIVPLVILMCACSDGFRALAFAADYAREHTAQLCEDLMAIGDMVARYYE